MKVEIVGKVLSRTHRMTPKGELYSIAIEEPSLFPSVFSVSSRDCTFFGKPDGPFAVGRLVRVRAYASGREREVTSKDGKPIKVYSVWFNASHIEPIAAVANPASDPAPSPASIPPIQQDPEDLPF